MKAKTVGLSTINQGGWVGEIGRINLIDRGINKLILTILMAKEQNHLPLSGVSKFPRVFYFFEVEKQTNFMSLKFIRNILLTYRKTQVNFQRIKFSSFPEKK